MFDYSECPRSDEEFRACLSTIRATIPLLERSQYAEIQKGRVQQLREFYEFDKAHTSLLCT